MVSRQSLKDAELELLTSDRTRAIAAADGLSEVIEDAARDLAPHLIAFYLKALAGDLHSYNTCGFWWMTTG